MQNLVKKLVLTNFRNHKTLTIEPVTRVVAVLGKNGVGKTNILESISLLSTGRGLRSAKLQEIKSFDAPSSENWVIYSEIVGAEGEAQIGTSLGYTNSGKEKRRARINQEDIRGTSELADYFSYVSLTPQQDHTFTAGSTSRRNYLDKLCEIFFPTYEEMLKTYDITRYERRKLLANSYDEYWVNALEQRMAEKGVAIAFCRLELCELLNSFMSEAAKSGFPEAHLDVSGEVEDFLKTSHKALDVENYFKEKLLENRIFDAHSKRTNFGIHRSDFRVTHKNKNIPAEFTSQGEQKAVLLAITIASVLAKKSRSGFYPVLLLDEVASHLDENKRANLYDFINTVPCQTWLTSTEKEHFTGLKEVEFICL